MTGSNHKAGVVAYEGQAAESKTFQINIAQRGMVRPNEAQC